MALRIRKCSHAIFDQHCGSCKKLKKEWYQKLAKDAKVNPDEGFTDIERTDYKNQGDILKVYSSEFYSKDYDMLVRNSKQEYYQLALNFLGEYKFETPRDKNIWAYHVEGISMRNISKLLKKVRVHMNRNDVNAVIKRLKLKMFDMYIMKAETKHE